MIFQFKKFAVSHGQSSMRVGTDAVLLGTWADIKNSEKILDIGTGCGIIALMMAQRNDSTIIIGLDIHPESVLEAKMNFENSPWANRLEAELISLQKFTTAIDHSFSHIISNPPFFLNSLPSPIKTRHEARHTDSLSPEDFFEYSRKLLVDTGNISMILPFHNLSHWLETAGQSLFYPTRITQVLSYPGKPVERVLIEFSRIPGNLVTNDLHIRKGKGLGYSEKYLELTDGFYL